MTSKTRMEALVRAWDWGAVEAALAETPKLADVRDRRGRNWLHIACMVELTPARDAADSVRMADRLLARGFGIEDAAFTEPDFRATPLWHAVAHGKNHALIAHLLGRGASPLYCLWAAAYNDDAVTIGLLAGAGAPLDGVAEGETPLLFAVTYSAFAAVEALLKQGADPNRLDAKGRTALHRMLNKGGDIAHLEMMLANGASLDVADAEGRTVREILGRKRDPALKALVDRR
ncbi:ankyrin repeat domain-containing protein [Phenylobacterium sp.]|uniref:ankyrin repeat domain-containing protein n=1 Tax=Phenylobacterium sp. TaxID=1871053 RepID=UPI003561EC95